MGFCAAYYPGNPPSNQVWVNLFIEIILQFLLSFVLKIYLPVIHGLHFIKVVLISVYLISK